NQGRLIALDTPEAIAAEVGVNRVRFVPSQPVDDKTLYAVPGVQLVERKDRYLTVTGTGDLAASLINALAAMGVHVSELDARSGNLDDAFIRLTRDTAATDRGRAQV
ncbi:MAG TPA: hypothetical protein VMV09_06790, partial [Candidatus Saccharimonadales bacterium]|nr:hypothetical protein [Candidatus Saccharimonadales bacterium]